MKHIFIFSLLLFSFFTLFLSAQNELVACADNHLEEASLNTACDESTAPVDTPRAPKERRNAPNFKAPAATITKTDTNYVPPERFKTRLPQALYLPGALIVWGVSTMGSHGLYSSHQARTDLLSLTKGKGGPVDDYLIYSPYVEFGALLLLNVKCRSDLVNLTLLIAKSEALMLATVYSLKYIVKEERPYSWAKGQPPTNLSLAYRKEHAGSQDFLSFPSGHAGEAFVAATIVYREYRYLSPWYGIGAYALATTVGLYRMINDQHWESDVFVGAGLGIASANVVYATHKHRWGRNDICIVPTYDGTNKGILLGYSF